MKRLRRHTLMVSLALAGFFTVASRSGATAEGERPNIVILYADDMGYGDLAVQNPDSKIPTPHLDRLAREGMRFTDAHSSCGVCTPSRYALLEGRYHWRKFHGIVNSFEPSVLDADKQTLPELLRAQGYRTAAFGKWHLGWDWQAIRRPEVPAREGDGKSRTYPPEAFDWSQPIPDGPLAHGFDTYFGDDVPNFPPYAWIENDRLPVAPTVDWGAVGEPAEGNWECRPGPAVEGWDCAAVMPTLTERAVAWIGQQRADKPFFLYFPFTSPHTPIVPAAEFSGASRCGGYGNYLRQTDAAVGRVLAALERQGLAANTLVIFTSDNGPERLAYDRLRACGHSSMGGLRGLKRDLWEGGHRVPFVVRWPGVVPAGGVSPGLLSQIDIFATVAAFVGATVQPGSAEDSLDQTRLWTGQGESVRDTLVYNTFPGAYALRHREWVLIDAPQGGTPAPAWFHAACGYASPAEADRAGGLYNLQTDLAQRHNLLAARPDLVAELRSRLDALLPDRGTEKPAN